MQKNCCPVCDSVKTEIKCELDDTNRDRFLEFSEIKFSGYLQEIINIGLHPIIYGCNQCGFCWYNEIPTNNQLMKMYSCGKSLGLTPTFEHKIIKEKAITELLNGLLRIIKKNNNISLLDYGSGKGGFSQMASVSGFNVTAFEPSLSRNMLKTKKNINYINDLSVLKNSKIKFDVIVLDNVLEHLPDPKLALLEIHKYCNKNTIIYVSVPNILRAHEGKDIWDLWPYKKDTMVHTMAPFEHLSGFTPKSLDLLLKKCSYSNISQIDNFIFSPLIFIKKIILNLFSLGGSTMRIIKIK